jgi:transposase
VDEAGFSTQPARRTTWGIRGRTPVLKIAGRGWKKISAAAALTVSPGRHGGGGATRRRVGQFFRLYDQDIDGAACAEFLRALLRQVRGPVTLLWDGLAVHRSPPVKAVLARCKRVEVHRLPSYAPELNPVEPVWANGKGVKLRGVVPDDQDHLYVETTLALEDIAADQHLLRSFFNATPLVLPGITP